MLDSHTYAEHDDAVRLNNPSRSIKESVEALIGLAPPVPAGQTYDVGPDCPRDDLYYRLEACRALQRMHPPQLGAIRRYS